MIKVILKDIVEKPITGEWGNEGNSVNVLRTTNFTNEGFINFTKVVKRDVEQKKIDLKRLARGDIIIEKSGGSPTQPVGRVVYFDSEEIFLCNNFTAILRPKKEQVFPKYLHYLLFVGHQFGLTSAFQNKTTGIINLQLTKYLEGIKIPLPPLPQQQKIANILDAADALRQKDKALLAKYDELTQALFLDMFGDPVSNPKGWEMKLVENLASNEKNSVKAGPFGSSLKKEFYVQSGYKIYGQEQVIKDDMSFGNYYIDEKKYKELESCKVKEGDILVSLVGTYGKISIIPKVFEEGVINPRLMKISPNMKIIRPDFLKILLQSVFVTRQLKSQSRGGTMDIINVGIIRKVIVPLPPINLQNQFAERVQVIVQQKAIAQQSLEKSEALFNSLLQKAFKGELV
jgi:type I restriction enzyme S subunit